MDVLTPREAAGIARGVYLLRDKSVSAARDRDLDLGCEGLFKVGDESRFVGISGALAWKRLSGFGYVAEGEGRRAGEILVATRGTAIGADWLSNLNIGLETGPGGHLVHAGFNEVWKSFSEELRGFLRGRNPSHIHCVGHSLGGALASLNADCFSAARVAKVSLYTFGAPRVGLPPFSRALSGSLGPSGIFRVSHQADPVPMIPIFPYRHLPYSRPGYHLSNGGDLISVAAHSMVGSYIPGVGDSSWATLPKEDSAVTWDEKVKAWLESSAGSSGPAVFSARLLGMIATALRWVLKQAKNVVLGAIGTVLAAGATLLDQLAWLLSKGAELSAEIAGYVRTLIGAIFRFLGRAAAAAVDLTVAFLRWVLGLLVVPLQAAVARAITLAPRL